MYVAASAASPFAQAAKNFAEVSLTSAPLGGPLFTGAGPPALPLSLPSSALTTLNAPYPAPPTITANTLPMMAAFAPLRIARNPPRGPLFRTSERVQKSRPA